MASRNRKWLSIGLSAAVIVVIIAAPMLIFPAVCPFSQVETAADTNGNERRSEQQAAAQGEDATKPTQKTIPIIDSAQQADEGNREHEHPGEEEWHPKGWREKFWCEIKASDIFLHCRPVKRAVSADKGMILKAILAI